MEIIQLSGYTEQEKAIIGRDYLIPRQIRENGLHDEEITFAPEAIQTIIRDYTREAGCAQLERQIGKLARKVCHQDCRGEVTHLTVTSPLSR
ncbi:MAG UNVERIFIED_CONTAM: hypothetical protein LVT10_13890 [Anaerolineae bacterium]|jgi:ATP-dependent Lon protease